MKLRPMILLCSLGLLAAQAGAEGSAATDAQAAANQSETTAIRRPARSEMIPTATQTIKTESATQADVPKEKIVKGKMRETKMAALGNLHVTNKYQEGGNVSLADKASPSGVTLRNGAQFVAIHANDGVNQTNTTFVVCHPCQPGDRSGSCCAVGCD